MKSGSKRELEFLEALHLLVRCRVPLRCFRQRHGFLEGIWNVDNVLPVQTTVNLGGGGDEGVLHDV